MKARTNLRPSMESLLPGLQFEKKIAQIGGKLVYCNATANFFWDTLYVCMCVGMCLCASVRDVLVEKLRQTVNVHILVYSLTEIVV